MEAEIIEMLSSIQSEQAILTGRLTVVFVAILVIMVLTLLHVLFAHHRG